MVRFILTSEIGCCNIYLNIIENSAVSNMKRHDYALFVFSGGLILLVIQFLIILFNTLNGTNPLDETVFLFAEEISFVDVLTAIWPSLVGTVLLIVVYFRRFIKGPDAMLVLVGAILWFIQLLNLYDTAYDTRKFILHYILGVVGFVLIVITGFWEAYTIKRGGRADDFNE